MAKRWNGRRKPTFGNRIKDLLRGLDCNWVVGVARNGLEEYDGPELRGFEYHDDGLMLFMTLEYSVLVPLDALLSCRHQEHQKDVLLELLRSEVERIRE